MSTVLGLVIVLGALAHLIARIAFVRRHPQAGLLRNAGLLGSIVVMACGAWLVAFGSGVPAAARAFALSRGVGHGMFEAVDQTAGLWALGAGLALLSGAHRSLERSGPWATLALSVLGLGGALGALALLTAPASLGVGVSSHTAALFAVANGALLAGGLAFLVLALLLATNESQLAHASWLALGLVLATAIAAVFMAYGAPYWNGGIFLPLSDARGVDVEVQFAVGAAADRSLVALRAVATGSAPSLGYGLLATMFLAVAAGLVSSFRRHEGRWLFIATGVAALLTLVMLWQQAAPVAVPTTEQLLDTIAGAGMSRDVVNGAPTLSATKGLQITIGTVLPVALVLWTVGVVALYRGVAPMASAVPQRRYAPGPALAASRDAAMVGALLLWLGVAMGFYAAFELTGRYVTSHHVGGYVALAAMASASVLSWHAALGRPSRASFGSWVVLPAATLVLAALVMVAGVVTNGPFTLLSSVP